MSNPWPPRITIDPLVILETQAVPYNYVAFRDAVLAITALRRSRA